MSKEDILLRETINAPLTTKGSEFTYADLDANWIEIYNQFVLLSQSSQVPAYSAAIEYSIDEYVRHSSQLWKMVNGTPQTNVTPGTDPLTWLKVYASDMVQAPVIGGATILTKEISLTSVQILTLNGVDSFLELIPNPGAGKYIDLIHSVLNLDFNSAHYEAFNSLEIGFTNVLGSGGSGLWEMDQGLRSEVSQVRRFENKFPAYSASDKYLVSADSLSLTTVGGAPTLGDSDIKINLTYQILSL